MGPEAAMPKSLRERARWFRRGPVPLMLVHPDLGGTDPLPARPTLLWMHGRTAHKELDNGRYLRLIRAGIASVAIDLPGHGERADPAMQGPERSMEVIETMLREWPHVEQAIADEPGLDASRVAVGGMSLGGMVTLARLCRPHRFRAAWVEATSGDWSDLHAARQDPARADRMEPARHLDHWSPIPLLAVHAERDAWIHIAWQRRFLERVRGVNQGMPVQLLAFARTGAPHEHIGFGTMSAAAKDTGVSFLQEHLT